MTEEEKRGNATDREANKKLTSSSSPSKFKTMGESRHITEQNDNANAYLLNAGRPSTEFKTKSGIKASQAFETTGSHQVVSTYEEQEETSAARHGAVDFHPNRASNEYSNRGRGAAGMDSDEDMEAK